jgi:transcriptional regulator with XRE-family HTH domain
MEFDALKKISYVLRFYRRIKGCSQLEMAEILGISARNFQRLEMGEVEPKLETLVRIAQSLNVPVSSLIRNTDQESLSIFDVSSYRERSEFQELSRKTQKNNEDLHFAEKLVAKDRCELPDKEHEAQLVGNIATLSETALKLSGLSQATFDIQPFVMLGSAAERWEFAFRRNLKRAVIENVYTFPIGIVVLQEYHHNLEPNPDNPRSEIYLRDISGRHNLDMWLKSIRTA